MVRAFENSRCNMYSLSATQILFSAQRAAPPANDSGSKTNYSCYSPQSRLESPGDSVFVEPEYAGLIDWNFA